jgi:predicted cupin superfamily sugar epimerase
MDDRARELIHGLGLQPHPEGGHYREIHRSESHVEPFDGRAQRTAGTAIYFLLAAGEVSRWHRVASDETWHHYEGEPLELWIAAPDGARSRRVLLGRALETEGPSFTVPAHYWQAARSAGAYSLAGCTVSPGFEFDDFRFLRDDAEAAKRLQAHAPELAALL